MIRLTLCLLAAGLLPAQTYDLLLKRGHVIDPANNLDRVLDVAVAAGKVVRVAPDIPAAQSKKTIDAAGLYVTPGLIDLHTHVYVRGRWSTLFPDDTALPTGVTTVVDCGVSGWRTFEDFKRTIIDKSRTRVLAFLNILGGGMSDERGVEQNVADMDPAAAAAKVKQYPDVIVGIKHAHYTGPGWEAFKRAIEAGRLSGKPVMVDNAIYTNTGRTTREKVLDYMRPGDLHTHMYNDHQVELLDRFSGKVQPYMSEARQRGVLFDLGHGGGGFLWPVASRAMHQGFPPDTISTDLHTSSIMRPHVNMPNCISKLMALGMELPDAIRRATVNPARAIRRFPELGTLGEGRTADIAVFDLKSGVFALTDSWGTKRMANRKLECVLTVRDGKLVYDLNGLGFPLWSTAGDYEVIP
jgi:dihydroorotase